MAGASPRAPLFPEMYRSYRSMNVETQTLTPRAPWLGCSYACALWRPSGFTSLSRFHLCGISGQYRDRFSLLVDLRTFVIQSCGSSVRVRWFSGGSVPGYNTFFMEPGRRAQYSGFDPRLPVGGNPSPLTSHMVAPGQSSNFFSLPSGFGPMIEIKGTKTLLVPSQGVNTKWLD